MCARYARGHEGKRGGGAERGFSLHNRPVLKKLYREAMAIELAKLAGGTGDRVAPQRA
jgi:hypothetical protein